MLCSWHDAVCVSRVFGSVKEGGRVSDLFLCDVIAGGGSRALLGVCGKYGTVNCGQANPGDFVLGHCGSIDGLGRPVVAKPASGRLGKASSWKTSWNEYMCVLCIDG
jgi:hypothetical protein